MTIHKAGWLIGMMVCLTTADASAFCRMTTADPVQIGNTDCSTEGSPLAWQWSFLSYAVDERGSQWLDFNDVVQVVDVAFNAWVTVTCGGEDLDLRLQPLQSSRCRVAEFNNSGGNVNTVAFLEEWEDADGDPFDRNAFAVTLVWHDPSSGKIFDADILVNENLGPYARCPVSGCPAGSGNQRGPADLGSIVTHEAGHFFGIGHTPVEEATMFPSVDRRDASKRSLAQDDRDGICAAYPPGTLAPDNDPTPFGGLDLNCEDGPSSNGGGKSGCAVSFTEPSEWTGWLVLLGVILFWIGWRRRV